LITCRAALSVIRRLLIFAHAERCIIFVLDCQGVLRLEILLLEIP
jgi:hypothetical protein